MNSAIMRAIAAVRLLWCLLVSMITSGIQTVRVIARPSRATPGFADYWFSPMGDGGATVLACLVCLTPGTTAIEVSPRQGWIRIHLLDCKEREASLNEIRTRFEPLVRIIFERSAGR